MSKDIVASRLGKVCHSRIAVTIWQGISKIVVPVRNTRSVHIQLARPAQPACFCTSARAYHIVDLTTHNARNSWTLPTQQGGTHLTEVSVQPPAVEYAAAYEKLL